MIVDSSAVLAILRGESDASAYFQALYSAWRPRMSAATYLETSIVVDASDDPVLSRRLDELLLEAGVIIEPVTAEQARIGREAYRDFGRGSGSSAKLNFGDCFAYALARVTREPLLFKGQDFAQTDLESVI